jgi:small ligand-binding sensory domain FIST
MTKTIKGEGDGAVFREALVERAMGKVVHGLSPHERALVMGGVRIGVLEAAHEIAKMYPQLAERIYERFGMSGWR